MSTLCTYSSVFLRIWKSMCTEWAGHTLPYSLGNHKLQHKVCHIHYTGYMSDCMSDCIWSLIRNNSFQKKFICRFRQDLDKEDLDIPSLVRMWVTKMINKRGIVEGLAALLCSTYVWRTCDDLLFDQNLADSINSLIYVFFYVMITRRTVGNVRESNFRSRNSLYRAARLNHYTTPPRFVYISYEI